MYVFRDVKTGFELAVFTIAHFLAVYPYTHVRGCRADVQEDIASLPRRVNGECTSVLTCIIVLKRRNRRVIIVVTSPCIADIHINRITIPVELPHPGNRDRVPCRVIITN